MTGEEEHNWEIEKISNEEELDDFLEELIKEVKGFNEETELEEVYTHVGFANHVLQQSSEVLFTEHSEASVSSNPFNNQSPSPTINFSKPAAINFPSKSQKLKNKLQNWIQKLRQKVQAIASNHKNADSYSISVGTPLSVSVSVTFNV